MPTRILTAIALCAVFATSASTAHAFEKGPPIGTPSNVTPLSNILEGKTPHKELSPNTKGPLRNLSKSSSILEHHTGIRAPYDPRLGKLRFDQRCRYVTCY